MRSIALDGFPLAIASPTSTPPRLFEQPRGRQRPSSTHSDVLEIDGSLRPDFSAVLGELVSQPVFKSFFIFVADQGCREAIK